VNTTTTAAAAADELQSIISDSEDLGCWSEEEMMKGLHIERVKEGGRKDRGRVGVNVTRLLTLHSSDSGHTSSGCSPA